jgi:hypothetical protein
MIDLSATVAVISDIHIGEHARSEDLCPLTLSKKPKNGNERFLEKFEDYVQKRPPRIRVQGESL